MKKVLFFAALGAAAALQAFAPSQQKNMLIEDGKLIPDFAGTTVFQSTFKKAEWSINNHEKHIKITYAGWNGKPGMLFRNGIGKKDDTAWRLLSRKLTIPSGKSFFCLQVTIQTNQVLRTARGGATYSSRLIWFTAAGKRISPDTTLILNAGGSISHTDIFRGAIPDGASSVQIQLGADHPNLELKDYILFKKADLVFLDKEDRGQGSVISSVLPCRNGDVFSYEADVPAGSKLTFSVATMVSGQTAFSPWTPIRRGETLRIPAGKEVLLRWKADFTPAGKKYPVLKSVRIGKLEDTKWSEFNSTENPVVQRVSASPEKNARTPFVFHVTGAVPVRYSSLKAFLDKKDVTALLKRDGARYTLLPKEGFTPGAHALEVTVQSVSGVSAKEELWFFIGIPKRVPKTTVRDDGMLLIDGKPFFPIGIYSVRKHKFNHNSYEEAFKGLKEAGFNTAQSYKLDDPDFLAAAEKYDVKLFIAAGPMPILNKKLGMKNILAWYVGDDTHVNTAPRELQRRVDRLKAIDPYRICVQADPACGYRNYVKITEGFLPEIYPVHKDTLRDRMECVPTVIQDMKTVREDLIRAKTFDRTVWSICQYMEGWSLWKRFPTPVELRAMSWASIVCGATGITWYTYAPGASKNHGAIYTPETWKTMTTVSKEIASYQNILVERSLPAPAAEVIKGAKKDVMGHNSIHVMAKKHDGKIWVFAVNSAYEPVTAKITVNKKSVVKEFKTYGVEIFSL